MAIDFVRRVSEGFRGDINASSSTNDGMTPLNIAVRMGVMKLINAMIEGGARVDQADKNGMTPLHRACRDGNVEIATLLLKKGADVDVKDISGKTPKPISLRSPVSGDTKRNFHAPRAFVFVECRRNPVTVPSGIGLSVGLIALAVTSLSISI